MPDDLRVIVQRMIDAGESEENIATVIRASGTAPSAPPEPAQRRQTPQSQAAALSLLGIRPGAVGLRDPIVEHAPTIGGAAGGMVGGPLGAAIGGGAGEIVRQMGDALRPTPTAMSPWQRVTAVGKEGAIQGAMEGAGKLVSLAGKGLYKGGVAMLPKALKQQHPNIVSRGFEEGIPLTRRGGEKAGRLATASRQQADTMIGAAERAGAPPVLPMEVVRELRSVGGKIQDRTALGATDEMPALMQRAKTFISLNKNGIPLTRAQALKREAQDLATTAYKARDRGAVINTTEALTNEAQARGLRRGIEQRVPGVGAVNARTQDLAGVQRGAEHASETAHVYPRLMSAGLAGAAFSGGGALPALAAGGAGAMLGTPGGLTATGLLLKKGGQAAPHLGRAALLALMASHQPE